MTDSRPFLEEQYQQHIKPAIAAVLRSTDEDLSNNDLSIILQLALAELPEELDVSFPYDPEEAETLVARLRRELEQGPPILLIMGVNEPQDIQSRMWRKAWAQKEQGDPARFAWELTFIMALSLILGLLYYGEIALLSSAPLFLLLPGFIGWIMEEE